jgi:hypothetical protein
LRMVSSRLAPVRAASLCWVSTFAPRAGAAAHNSDTIKTNPDFLPTPQKQSSFIKWLLFVLPRPVELKPRVESRHRKSTLRNRTWETYVSTGGEGAFLVERVRADLRQAATKHRNLAEGRSAGGCGSKLENDWMGADRVAFTGCFYFRPWFASRPNNASCKSSLNVAQWRCCRNDSEPRSTCVGGI